MGTKEVKPQLKKGLWKPEEDLILKNYVETYGEGNWAIVSHRSGLMREGKSCRLRWKNYLRPNIKHGGMSEDEKDLIIRLHKLLGNRWSLIAGRLPGRTDNEVKNYWNTHLNKKCPRGERTRRIDPNNNNRNKTPLPSSEPIHSENTENSSNGGLSKEEHNGSTTVSHSWIEDMKSFFSDIKSPLPMNFEPFFYDDEILMPMMDNYVLFEAFGTNGDQTFQEGMLPLGL